MAAVFHSKSCWGSLPQSVAALSYSSTTLVPGIPGTKVGHPTQEIPQETGGPEFGCLIYLYCVITTPAPFARYVMVSPDKLVYIPQLLK